MNQMVSQEVKFFIFWSFYSNEQFSFFAEIISVIYNFSYHYYVNYSFFTTSLKCFD